MGNSATTLSFPPLSCACLALTEKVSERKEETAQLYRQMDEEISFPRNKTRPVYFDLTEECVFTCISLCAVATRNTGSFIADCELPVCDIFHTEETRGLNWSSSLLVGKLLVRTQQFIIPTV